MSRAATDPDARFWAFVVMGEDGCWLWTGGCGRWGYGRFHPESHRAVAAHRYAYERMVGEIPEGLELDHICRVRLCVNPFHLDPVTRAVNAARTAGHRKVPEPKTVCANGHAMTEENSRPNPERPGRFVCRTCRNASSRAYYQRRRGRAA